MYSSDNAEEKSVAQPVYLWLENYLPLSDREVSYQWKAQVQGSKGLLQALSDASRYCTIPQKHTMECQGLFIAVVSLHHWFMWYLVKKGLSTWRKRQAPIILMWLYLPLFIIRDCQLSQPCLKVVVKAGRCNWASTSMVWPSQGNLFAPKCHND